MDIAMKLDFDDCDEDGDVNSSILTVNSEYDDHEQNKSFEMKNIRDSSYYNMCSSPEEPLSPRKEIRNSSMPYNSDSPPYKRIRALRLFDAPTTPKTLLQKCAADSTSVPRQDCVSDPHFQVESEDLRPIARTVRESAWSKPYDVVYTSRPSQIRSFSRFSNHESWRSKHLYQDKDSNTTFDTPMFNRLSLNSSKCTNTPTAANINPFTPSGMMLNLSRKRTRSSRDLNKSGNEPVVCDWTTETASLSSSDDPTSCNTSTIEEDEDEEITHPPKRLTIHEANVYRYHEEFLELSLIGRGQFGSVYKCRHRLDGCIYAIKKSLKPVAGSATERIALNEVYAHAVLGKHPHVVRYYSAWAENDHMIIQNEYCVGGSLAEALENSRNTQTSFTEAQLKQILLHVAKGLRYIHQQQLVHMDIKPGNIFISREPHLTTEGEDSADDGFEEDVENEEHEGVVYKIGDLGHVTSTLNPQVEEGDCRYLPREILQEDFSHLQKADIFALGLTIYECASGTALPLNGEEWHSLRDGQFSPLTAMSSELQMLLKHMIHSDPCERPTAAQLVQQLSYCRSTNKSQAQLRRELNAEKLKNEILSRQLREAAKCLQNISPNVTSSELTAAVVSGVLAGVCPAPPQRGSTSSSSRLSNDIKSGPITRGNSNSRVIGKKVNRSVSATTF